MLFSHFESVLQRHTASPRPILLALSGGIDSRVMLNLLAQFRVAYPQHDYAVVHVHHGLSKNADKWLTQCQSWAESLNFPFYGVKVKLNHKRKSLEQAAREARYQAIENLMKPNTLVLTAQHADDQAETVLLALKRGSGLAGLAAMPEIRPFSCGELLRPFLFVERRDIEAFAQKNQLEWLEDESNQNCRFDRNYIRHQWLPMAQERWPQISKSIQQTAARCADDFALLDELLMPYERKTYLDDGGLCLDQLREFSRKIQMALVRRWVKRMSGTACGHDRCVEIFQTMIEAREDANPHINFGGKKLRRHKQTLYFVSQREDISALSKSLKIGQWSSLPDGLGQLGLFTTSGNTATGLRLISPQNETVIMVKFQPSALFAHPVGRQGKRKLKKLFQEYNVPSWQRRRIPLIFYGESLVAVGDLFVCEGFSGNDLFLHWQK